MKKSALVILLVLLGAGGAFFTVLTLKTPVTKGPKTQSCSKHKISTCPFCDKSLIEKMGMCPGHKVPEALCSRCNASLIPAFKAENDWCGGHDLPESQCTICNPELLQAKAEDGLCGKHKVPSEQCPFCDTSLIAKMGMCPGHKVPEALCSRCNASLIPAFKAENDWCGGHDLPESQCTDCNPELLQTKAPEPANQTGDIVLAPLGGQERLLSPPTFGCRTHKLQVDLSSPDTATKIGLETVLVVQRSVTKALNCNA
jgi:hypothetical protein